MGDFYFGRVCVCARAHILGETNQTKNYCKQNSHVYLYGNYDCAGRGVISQQKLEHYTR